MITRLEVQRIARTWLGVPFLHQGRSRQGVDCGGLLLCVGEEAGLSLIHPGTYSMSPEPNLVLDAITANCDRIALLEIMPGDVLHFSFAGEPRHVGIASDIGVIHAWAKPKKVVEHRLDEIWLRRLMGTYRVRGIE